MPYRNFIVETLGKLMQQHCRIIVHPDKLKILEEIKIMQGSLQESARNPVPVQQQRNQMMKRKSNDINLLIHLMLLGVNLACKGKDML